MKNSKCRLSQTVSVNIVDIDLYNFCFTLVELYKSTVSLPCFFTVWVVVEASKMLCMDAHACVCHTCVSLLRKCSPFRFTARTHGAWMEAELQLWIKKKEDPNIGKALTSPKCGENKASYYSSSNAWKVNVSWWWWNILPRNCARAWCGFKGWTCCMCCVVMFSHICGLCLL